MKALILIVAVITAKVGYQIHHSVAWSIMDFLFFGFAWIKWLLCNEVNLSIIKEAFSFFLT